MDIAKQWAIWNSVRVFPRKWRGNGMVVRDEIPGDENHNINQWFDKMARAPMLCLREVFLFGFTLLAASTSFDARPVMAQYIGVGPFGVYLGGGHRYHGGGYYHRHSHHHVYYHSHRHSSYRYGPSPVIAERSWPSWRWFDAGPLDLSAHTPAPVRYGAGSAG